MSQNFIKTAYFKLLVDINVIFLMKFGRAFRKSHRLQFAHDYTKTYFGTMLSAGFK